MCLKMGQLWIDVGKPFSGISQSRLSVNDKNSHEKAGGHPGHAHLAELRRATHDDKSPNDKVAVRFGVSREGDHRSLRD